MGDKQDEAAAAPAGGHGRALNPVLMMLAAMALAIVMTWIVPSGRYQRTGAGENSPVVAGTYAEVPKPLHLDDLVPRANCCGVARPVSPLALATSVPAGLVRSAPLIFMILLLGGLFGVLRASGALDAGVRRLIGLSGGNISVLVPVLMLALSAGSTFLGLISEYLLLIPVMLVLADRLGRSRLFGFALLTLAAKIGYLASVTNPVALLVAQPIVNLPAFSGLAFRFAVWVVFLAIVIGVVLRLGQPTHAPEAISREPLAPRHFLILLIMGITVALLAYGSLRLGWDDRELSALFIVAALVISVVSHLPVGATAQAFVTGMKANVLAGLLIGMGRAVEIILRDGQILDTIIDAVAQRVADLPHAVVAPLLMLFEMVLTLLVPSTSAKAALSIPVLGPIAASVGVSGQTTVLAFLLGNGLVNMMAPTSGMLLAFLAAAGIPYGEWFRFVLPLFIVLTVLSAAATVIAVLVGY